MAKKDAFKASADQIRKWSAEERYFSSLSQVFIDRTTRIFGIMPFAPEIGYTLVNKGDIADIHIARLHQIMESLSEQERSFFRLGVYAHEALHQIYTNFDETNRIIDSYKRQTEKNIFSQVSNIVEDTRIEYFADQVIGGEALSALHYTIKVVYLEGELGKETHPVSQALNALIHLGDMGVVRGKFTMPEAFEIFSRIVPLFEEAVKMPVCADALQVSKQICEIIFEYIDFEFEDYLNELFKMADERRGSGKGSDAEGDDEGDDGDGSEGMSGSGSSKSKRSRAKETLKKLGIESKPASKTGEGEELTSEGLSESGTGGKDSSDTSESSSGSHTVDLDTLLPSMKDDIFDLDDEYIDTFGSKKEDDSSKPKESSEEGEDVSDETEGGKECSYSEEDIAAFNELLQEEFDKLSEEGMLSVDYSDEMRAVDEIIESEIKAEESRAASDATDKEKSSIPDTVEIKHDPFVKLIVNKKMSPVSAELYEPLVEKISPLINSTAKAIERIMKRETEEKERHTSGEVNLGRYHDVTYTSARVFDKRRDPLTLGDTCITIFVDESGSMGGPKEIAAREGAILLAEVCAKLKIPCYVAGYSADELRYEVDLRHYVTWKNTKADRTSLVALQGRRENRDGASIRAITEISKKRHEERKILFVISDGQPCANEYYGKSAILDTKNAIREARKVYEKVIGISIGSADINELHEMYGNDFVSVTNVSTLSVELSKLLKKMFK